MIALFKLKSSFLCKATKGIGGAADVEGQNSQTSAEILERRQNDQNAAAFSATSKGRPGLILLESCRSGLFGYSFKVQQRLHTPYSSISCLAGSRQQHRLEMMEVRADGKPCRVEKTLKCVVLSSFFFFFRLPVILKFNGLPSRQRLPSFPPEKPRATAHS